MPGAFQVLSDREAAAQIVAARGAYHAFFGAGLSVEAGVPTANRICEEIARAKLRDEFGDITFDDPRARDWLNRTLSWNKPEMRYSSCIRTAYASPADRVEFFRQTLVGIQPSFAHHGAALLMTSGVLGRTCLTSNFDKLLENAFAIQGDVECQALRTTSEVEFWRPDTARCFCLKVHGDYDTHNVLNTPDETVRLDESFQTTAEHLLHHKGLVVLGLAGYEKSLYSFFEELVREKKLANGMLSRGLLWGVFVRGPKPEGPSTPASTRAAVEQAIDEGGIGDDVLRLMNERANAKVRFAFFPVYGSGRFLMDLIETSRKRGLIGRAETFLDHEMRLRRVFGRAKLSATRVDEHIKNLARPALAANDESDKQSPVERAFEVTRYGKRIWVAYGNIASRSYLGHEDFHNSTRAVISPDDTFLSVGGGVAVALASRAGMRSILHEVSKFSPVPHGQSRVTSASDLPVHYIIHGATIEVTNTGYEVTREAVRETFQDALRRAVALDVNLLSVPLLGAGVAGLSPDESFAGLIDAYAAAGDDVPATVVFVIYKEAQIARAQARAMIDAALPDGTTDWSTAPWPQPPMTV
jgi:O-acetyl-ADP-ribose deacetylase (regulator of RNase III)